MLNELNPNLASSLLSGSLSGQNVSSVTNVLKKAYGTETETKDLIDEGKISEEALIKYQTEQEINYYKSLMKEMLGTEEESSDEISDLIKMVKSGDYNIDDSTLANSILNDIDAGDLLG